MTRGLTVPCNPHKLAVAVARPDTQVLFARRYRHTLMVVGAAGVTDHEILEEVNWHQGQRVLEIIVQGEVKPC
jgi:hypothetical protein